MKKKEVIELFKQGKIVLHRNTPFKDNLLSEILKIARPKKELHNMFDDNFYWTAKHAEVWLAAPFNNSIITKVVNLTEIIVDNNFTIDLNNKFYPDADKWMWDYCTFLGKFTDSKGINYDLGVCIQKEEIINATVYGNQPGSYNSLNFTRHFDAKAEDREHIIECHRRAKLLNIIK